MASTRLAIDAAVALTRTANPITRFKRGSQSLFNISIYTFGMTGVWIGFGTILLQYKATEIAANDPVQMFGWTLDKTSLAALISLIGLVIAAIIQPAVGLLSDRRVGTLELKRYPFIIVGLFGLATSTLLLGFAHSFLVLMVVTIAMQILGNTAQGPANALIIDHVDEHHRGKASGYLNLMRLAGAGVVTMLVLFLMSNYHVDEAPQWMWFSIILMVVVLLATSIYTLLALRRPKFRDDDDVIAPTVVDDRFAVDPEPDNSETESAEQGDRKRFYMVLVAMAFVIAALSATQTNAVFFLQDVIGLENPAQGGNYILAALVGSAAVVVYPAGKLSDHIGRAMLLLISGVLGAGGILSVLLIDAHALIEVIPGVMAIGFSVGIYLSVGWAVANDVVKRSTAARDLSLTSLSGLAGALLGRSSGFFIGGLNEAGLGLGIDYLGYSIVLGSTSLAFMVSGIVFWFVVADRR